MDGEVGVSSVTCCGYSETDDGGFGDVAFGEVGCACFALGVGGVGIDG